MSPQGGVYFKCVLCDNTFQGVGPCPFCNRGIGVRRI
jgi:hypothetical protein